MATQLYDVLGSKYPFGRGATSPTITSDGLIRRTGTGTIGQYVLNLNNPGPADGEIVVVHQTQGMAIPTEANWEANTIVSGGGTNTITLLNPLIRSYVNAQVITVNEYASPTLGDFNVSAWDPDTLLGAVYPIACRGTLTISGDFLLRGGNGAAGNSGNPLGGRGGGVPGGNSDEGNGDGIGGSQQGWGTAAAQSFTNVANGNGGGGGYYTGAPGGSSGAGGGNAFSGSNNISVNYQYPAYGGAISGDTEGTSLTPGGSGGGGCKEPNYTGGGGGGGGGVLIVWAYNIVVTGTTNLNGGNGANADAAGGAGAGGSAFLNCYKATLGDNLITAIAGTPGEGQYSGPQKCNGGSASVGRIKLNYYYGYTGTSNPTFSATQNSRLRIPGATPIIIG